MKYTSAFLLLTISIGSFAEDLSLCVKGWEFSEKGYYEKAIELFDGCIELGRLTNESLARTYRNIGITRKKEGKYEEAIKNYNMALSLEPRDPWDDYVNRGNSWSELGEYKKAFEDYDRAIELKPNYNEVYFNRGIVYEKQGKFLDALTQFKKAYDHGLRSKLLYDRFVVYGLVKKD